MPQNDLTPPEVPFDEDCCQGGCQNCVWDVYYEALAEYKEQLAKNTQNSLSDDAIDETNKVDQNKDNK